MPAAGAAKELLSVDPSVGLVASGVGLTSAGVVLGVVLTEERGLSRTVGRSLLLKRRDRLVSGRDRFLRSERENGDCIIINFVEAIAFYRVCKGAIIN